MKHLFLIILLINLGFSLTKAQQSSSLEDKGIEILNFRYLTSTEKDLFFSFDFDQYRKYNERTQIQIENGPMLKLFSIKELTDKGIAVRQEIINQKKNMDSGNVKHELIPFVNIGFGKTLAKELH